MQTTVSPHLTISASERVHRALQLNKDHQAAVKTQIDQLERDLAALDKLLVGACDMSAIGKLTEHPRLLRKSTMKTSSSLTSAGISPSPDPQRSQLQ